MSSSFDVVSSNPLSKCHTIAHSNLTRSIFTYSIFNCTSLFNLHDNSSKRSLCKTRSLTVIPKCKIAERLVFIELDFHCCDLFLQMEKMFSDKSLYTYIYLFLYIRMFSKNLSRNFKRYVLNKLTYIQGKDFCTLLYFKYIIT